MCRGSAPFHVERDRFNLTLQNLPAWLCNQCGEVCFEEEEVDRIQAVIQAVEDRSKDIPLPA